EQIRLTIGDANRSSMAGSFKTRKDELSQTLAWSEGALVLVLLALAYFTFSLFKNGGSAIDMSYPELLKRALMLSPLVWLAWFFTRKVVHLKRLREDDSFQYDAGMSFEGYIKHRGANDEPSTC